MYPWSYSSTIDTVGREPLTLRRLQFKTKLAAEKRQVMNFLSNQEKEKWIEDYADRETAVARKRVEDVTMDCITNLSNSTAVGYTGILIIVT